MEMKQIVARKHPKQKRSQATVDAILDATAHIFLKNGYERFNTNAVAEYAGVSIGSLYQYYPNKSALLLAVYERHRQIMTAKIEKLVKETASLEELSSIEKLVGSIIEAHSSESELIFRLEDWHAHLHCETHTSNSYLEPIITHIEKLLRDQNSRKSSADDHLSAFLWTHMIHGVIHAFIRTGDKSPFSTNAVICKLSRILYRYLNSENETQIKSFPD